MSVTDNEKTVFNYIVNPEMVDSLRLAPTEINGVKTAVITMLDEREKEDGSTEYDVMPLAVIVNDKIFDMLKNPLEE